MKLTMLTSGMERLRLDRHGLKHDVWIRGVLINTGHQTSFSCLVEIWVADKCVRHGLMVFYAIKLAPFKEVT